MSCDEGNDVGQLLSEGMYDLPVFLRYLKTFAMNGEMPDKAILLGILMQSLARFHTSDFTSCMCLVPSHVQDSPSVEADLVYIYELENLLSCGEFEKFWAQWADVKQHLPEPFHFETRVRTNILDAISLTVEAIPADRLAAYLAVPDDQLAKTIEAVKNSEDRIFEVTGCSDKEVTFARTPFNHPRAIAAQETLKFSDVVQILEYAN